MPTTHHLIKGKLYQAGLAGEITTLFIDVKPSVVIDCTRNLPFIGLRTHEMFIKCPFDDAPFPHGAEGIRLVTRLSDIGRLGAMMIRNGETLLVHSEHGENRASFVNGLILLELRAMGLLTFKNVVEYIHHLRPEALKNPAFIRYLEEKCWRT